MRASRIRYVVEVRYFGFRSWDEELSTTSFVKATKYYEQRRNRAVIQPGMCTFLVRLRSVRSEVLRETRP